ncbi:MAG: hypothetical protein HY235_09035 [Acidobacteria bacterium]|nr:hypothetical protein [Acidobacteriota bacterium]
MLIALWVSGARGQTAAAPARPDLFRQIDEILVELSKITGWKPPRKIHSDTITKEGVKQFLEDRIKDVVKPEEIRAEEIALKKLGLVPPDFDLRKTTVELMTEQAAAFYDYRKKKLFVLESNATLMQKPVLVHELAHAIADAHFNLEKYIFKGKSDDAAVARQAVMEGQATWLMSEYLMSKMGASLRSAPEMADVMNRMAGASGGMFPVFDSAPLYLRESLLFPYTKGFTFQQAVVVKLGNPGFSEVFRNPPASSQQILHPEKYFARIQPARPLLPKVELRGWDELIAGGLGELDHEILLRQYAGETEARLARKWRGSQFRVLERKKHEQFVLLYSSEWEDPKSAQEFFRLYRRVLAGKWKKLQVSRESETELAGAGDDGAFRTRLDGTRVTSMEGLPLP